MARPVRRRTLQSVTIRHVARRARVSPMTVSRVANGGAHVRACTRERVLRAIRELDYAPNPAARSLAAASPARVALLYANPSAAYLAELLVGALGQARSSGTQLLLEQWSAGEAGGAAGLARRLGRSVAGLVLPPPLCEQRALLSALAAAGLPHVALASGSQDARLSSVRIDNVAAARQMTEYLVSLGHRRIGFIRGHPDQSASALRFEGFAAGLHAAGLAPRAGWVRQGYFTYRSGLQAAEELLAQPIRPTAIFASNDDMANAVISVAHRRGLAVPRDLSVAGFDDTPVATTVYPELTTVRQPVAAMAAAAVELLVQQIRRMRAGEPVTAADRLFPHVLVERASTAAPPRSGP